MVTLISKTKRVQTLILHHLVHFANMNSINQWFIKVHLDT